ncbi:CLUMA_CG002117, isoform B [Clunio marinus]|nr:CLUMA_CG002117, isoform B [Clunio marinus]
MEDSKAIGQRKRIVVLRHGERVDFAFGNSWTQFSFNESQNYVRMDLNMPESLPPRAFEEWEKDSPLTTLGTFQSHLVGSSLKNFGVKFSKVFVSPAFRCVQTANGVLSAMGLESELPLNIEYGLFEWLGWYEMGLPSWVSPKQLGLHFNINENYQPVITQSNLEGVLKESLAEFYERNSSTTREILENCEGDILIVAHATNLETCTRQLTGKEPRTRSDMRNLLMKVPYLAAIAMQQNDDSSFQLIEPPCLSLTHNSCAKFDWRLLDDN